MYSYYLCDQFEDENKEMRGVCRLPKFLSESNESSNDKTKPNKMEIENEQEIEKDKKKKTNLNDMCHKIYDIILNTKKIKSYLRICKRDGQKLRST